MTTAYNTENRSWHPWNLMFLMQQTRSRTLLRISWKCPAWKCILGNLRTRCITLQVTLRAPSPDKLLGPLKLVLAKEEKTAKIHMTRQKNVFQPLPKGSASTFQTSCVYFPPDPKQSEGAGDRHMFGWDMILALLASVGIVYTHYKKLYFVCGCITVTSKWLQYEPSSVWKINASAGQNFELHKKIDRFTCSGTSFFWHFPARLPQWHSSPLFPPKKKNLQSHKFQLLIFPTSHSPAASHICQTAGAKHLQVIHETSFS